MHIQYKKRQLHFLMLLVVLFLGTIHVNAQSIVGPTQVAVGDVTRYTFSDPTNNTFLPGGWENDGRLLVDESQGYLPYTDARWDTVGTHYLGITCYDNNGDIVDYVTITVNVTYVEAPTPPGPRVQSNTLGVATLAWELYSTPPSGVTWYWQETSNGTSTDNSSSTISLSSGSVYYLRSRNNTTNTWSTNSSSVNYTLSPPPTWYYDTDGDGFGNRSPTMVGYTQPTGYVNNDKDACPDEAGPYDGCLTNNNENYVRTIQYQKPYSESDLVNAIPNSDKIESISYFDGLGRAKQNIAIRAGGNGEDIVAPISYDEYGRKDKEYLPYAIIGSNNNGFYRANALAATNTFYNTAKYENTANPYSQKEFEASPLNRVLKQAAPGTSWALGSGHEIKLDYQTNTNTDLVRRFGVSFVNGNTEDPHLEDNGLYAPSQLYKTITKDENWVSNQTNPNNHTTEEFKNKEGKVVLKRTFDAGKWHDTYYVYDNFGNLTYVLPPKASTYRNIMQQNWSGKQYFFEDASALFTAVDYSDMSFYFSPTGTLYISPYAEGSMIQLRNGLVMNLDFISPSLPDMNLGDMYFDNGIRAGDAYILAGNLYFNSSGLADTSSGYFYSSLTVNLQNYTPPPISQKELENLVYQYKYDKRNRLVEKKLPGKEWEFIIYDKLDRPILTQDANLKTQNKWMFTKYDAFSRPVYTGEYVNTTAGQTTRAGIQALADASAILFETKQGANTINGTTVYYSNNAFPNINNTNINLFTINYYDDYNFDLNGGVSTTSYTISPITNAKGLATGGKVRILDTTNWTTNVSYYDSKNRPIYGYSKNDYLATTSTVKSQFDFVGKTLETTSTHQRNNGTIITVVDSFTYDPAGRLLKQTQAINGATTPEVIAENVYDELGQLVQKKVGGKTNQNRLQTVDYAYNIRGWLKGINDNDTSNSAITIGSGDLFGFQINYNNPSTGTALYNGNISQTFWKTASTSSTSLKNYTYTYDALNRFKTASYAENNVLNNKFNETIYGYDRNGNIEQLSRNMQSPTNSNSFSTIDYLTYIYDSGNKLLEVRDAYGLSTDGKEGFKDGSINTMPGPGNDYSYDANGNMKFDANKAITSIAYNHLNLPIAVTINDAAEYNFGGILYVYDAMGVKLKKTVNDGTTEPYTYYAGNYVYNGNNLKFFAQPEGYIEPKNESDLSQGFNYIYQFKDHLGNVRLSYKDVSTTSTPSLQIIEENNYYPFGLKHKDSNNVVTSTNPALKYKYNGKELQDELGLNVTAMDYRQYDNALGRFYSPDVLSELAYSISPYRFAYNNPVYFGDPSGLFETRKEAREYRREHDISGGISKQKDGTFAINDKKNGVSYSKGDDSQGYDRFSNDGVQESIIVQAPTKKESNGGGSDYGWMTIWGTDRSGSTDGWKGTTTHSLESSDFITPQNSRSLNNASTGIWEWIMSLFKNSVDTSQQAITIEEAVKKNGNTSTMEVQNTEPVVNASVKIATYHFHLNDSTITKSTNTVNFNGKASDVKRQVDSTNNRNETRNSDKDAWLKSWGK